MEFALTLLAAAMAFALRQGVLTGLLLYAWILSFLASLVAPATWLTGVLAVIEMMVALGGLMLWTQHHNQKARLVSAISMVLLCAHFGYSATRGTGSWSLYAWILNLGFGLQCLTAGGGLDGLGRIYDHFRKRPHNVYSTGRRGR